MINASALDADNRPRYLLCGVSYKVKFSGTAIKSMRKTLATDNAC